MLCGVGLVPSRGQVSRLIFLLCITYACWAPFSVSGNDIRVPGNYSTLQAAVDGAANSGDTIYVDPSITTPTVCFLTGTLCILFQSSLTFDWDWIYFSVLCSFDLRE
jgi:hypothetical protein